jgi:predicted transcriptional regulator
MSVEEVVKRVEEVVEKAETIRRLADDIYYTLKDVQKFVAEKRRMESEPDWSLLDALVTRAYQNAVMTARDMQYVEEILRKLAEVMRSG